MTRTCGVDQQVASCEEPISADGLREFCTFHEDYVSRNIQLADTKAALVLLAFSSVIALSLRDPQFMEAMRKGFPLSVSRPFSLQSFLALASFFLCGVGIALAFWVVLPRFDTGRQAGQKAGYTFWKDVSSRARGDLAAYVQVMKSLSDEALLDDRLHHLAQLSRICSRKMSLLPFSMWIGALGVVAAAAWIILFAEHVA